MVAMVHKRPLRLGLQNEWKMEEVGEISEFVVSGGFF